MNRYLYCFAVAFVCIQMLLIISGCSKNATVKGTVKFPDGTPLTKGTVVFESDKIRVSSQLNSKGEYSLSGSKPGDGVPPGTYKGWILGAIADPPPPPKSATGRGAPNMRAIPKREPLIADKYQEAATSGFQLEITKTGKIIHDIVVEKPGTPDKR